jgi:hypothetical protein
MPLQARLRADPGTRRRAIWADLLGTRGDHAASTSRSSTRSRPPSPAGARAKRAQAALCRDRRKQPESPGGFPREVPRRDGRVWLDWNHKIRGKLVDRRSRAGLVNHVTDVAGPAEVHFGQLRPRSRQAVTRAAAS